MQRAMPKMNSPFIPANLAAEAPRFEWWGRDEHTGSTRYATPLLERLDLKTSNAFVVLCAGIVSWGAARLQGHCADTKTAEQLAEAALAYQVDWRYVDRDAIDVAIPRDAPPQQAALLELCIFLWRCLNHDKYWDNYYAPILETFHAAHLTRHMLPRTFKPAYSQWLAAVIDRLDLLAPKPDEDPASRADFETEAAWRAFIDRHRGRPLPPDVLDLQRTVAVADLDGLMDAWLRRLDWATNPFLRSPEQMHALGFTGLPYSLVKADS